MIQFSKFKDWESESGEVVTLVDILGMRASSPRYSILLCVLVLISIYTESMVLPEKSITCQRSNEHQVGITTLACESMHESPGALARGIELLGAGYLHCSYVGSKCIQVAFTCCQIPLVVTHFSLTAETFLIQFCLSHP